MFTGIVTDIGTVRQRDPLEAGVRLRIGTGYAPDGIDLGASIACSGICLTVVERGRDGAGAWFDVDASSETLAVTTMADWTVGTRINLERSLTLGQEMGGHMVTGHVDGLAEIVERQAEGDMAVFTFKVPAELARFVARKGSVALDGTSLTVNAVEGDRFSVMLIPHTIAVTTWGTRQAGDHVNIEVDLMARYVARLAEADAATARTSFPTVAARA
ncbi:riboflavin synthase subunit alpha [Prosthecomicrobium hirschii]|uniref:Riboflavin synthase n=1 Tax=Prosthecodimorpha hirschii TaxID=665126 RepID=A0A0P6W8K5_9HYPH|nr:riboflavin synthase [Prosthecomicrobium hirschii]KPL54952.1 riboflavin synthase subunit alpha [Prosthecomicrobium hirschii]